MFLPGFAYQYKLLYTIVRTIDLHWKRLSEILLSVISEVSFKRVMGITTVDRSYLASFLVNADWSISPETKILNIFWIILLVNSVIFCFRLTLAKYHHRFYVFSPLPCPPHMIKNDTSLTKHNRSAMPYEKSGKWNYIGEIVIEFFRIEFYRIYRICTIDRRLFSVIFIFKTTKNSFLQIL